MCGLVISMEKSDPKGDWVTSRIYLIYRDLSTFDYVRVPSPQPNRQNSARMQKRTPDAPIADCRGEVRPAHAPVRSSGKSLEEGKPPHLPPSLPSQPSALGPL